jgi:hypothetical protein
MGDGEVDENDNPVAGRKDGNMPGILLWSSLVYHQSEAGERRFCRTT